MRVDTAIFLSEVIAPMLISDILRLKGEYTYDPITNKVNNAHIIWSQRAGATKAWASSPWALVSRLKTIVELEPHEKGYAHSLEERQRILSKIIKQLEALSFHEDPKLLALVSLLDQLLHQGKKVIIFCLYRATISYLEVALTNHWC